MHNLSIPGTSAAQSWAKSFLFHILCNVVIMVRWLKFKRTAYSIIIGHAWMIIMIRPFKINCMVSVRNFSKRYEGGRWINAHAKKHTDTIFLYLSSPTLNKKPRWDPSPIQYSECPTVHPWECRLLNWQIDTHRDRTNFIPSTADVGGNKNAISKFE